MPPQDVSEGQKIFLMLCAVLGVMTLLVCFSGGPWVMNLTALILIWGLLFGCRYILKAAPIVYRYFQDLHHLHRTVDEAQQSASYHGKSLTPEEQAILDSMAERWKN